MALFQLAAPSVGFQKTIFVWRETQKTLLLWICWPARFLKNRKQAKECNIFGKTEEVLGMLSSDTPLTFQTNGVFYLTESK